MTKLLRKMEHEMLAIPAFILFTIFCAIPIIESFYYSFTDWNGVSAKANFVGVKNYLELFKDHEIVLPAIGHTLEYAFYVCILVTVIAIPLAVVLNAKLVSVKWLRAIFFFPSVPSALIIGFLWAFFLSTADYGPVNTILGWVGISPVNWLGEPSNARLSILLVSVWQGVGWHAVLYIANLQSIPSDYYESAQMDGANQWNKFRYITLPMLMPTFSISCLFLITGAFKLFDLPIALTNGGPGHSTYYLVHAIYNTGILENRYGRASALSIVLFVFILVVTLLQQKAMNRSEVQN